jgi:hypothetical protein
MYFYLSWRRGDERTFQAQQYPLKETTSLSLNGRTPHPTKDNGYAPFSNSRISDPKVPLPWPSRPVPIPKSYPNSPSCCQNSSPAPTKVSFHPCRAAGQTAGVTDWTNHPTLPSPIAFFSPPSPHPPARAKTLPTSCWSLLALRQSGTEWRAWRGKQQGRNEGRTEEGRRRQEGNSGIVHIYWIRFVLSRHVGTAHPVSAARPTQSVPLDIDEVGHTGEVSFRAGEGVGVVTTKADRWWGAGTGVTGITETVQTTELSRCHRLPHLP